MTEPNRNEINPVLLEAVESITRGMAEAFDNIWTRPDAARLVEGFLSERIVFQIDRRGVTIAERPDGDDTPADPPRGMYL